MVVLMKENPLLGNNLRACNILGMWPPDSPMLRIPFEFYSKLVYGWFTVFVITEFMELKNVYNDFVELTDNCGVSLLYAVVVAKVYVIIFKREKILTMVNIIRETEHEILESKDEKLKKILNDYILQNWFVSSRFWMLCFVTIVGYFIMPALELVIFGPTEILLTNGTFSGHYRKPLIFSSWFPFANKYEGVHYTIAWIVHLISGTIGASYAAITDTFMVALMIFAIGQFRVLQHYLLNIYPYDQDKIDTDVNELDLETHRSFEKKINENFVKCVKHHHMIIKFIKDLDYLISSVMFLDFLICSLMLCAVGLQAILGGPSMRLGLTVEYLVALLTQLFIFYWHANEVLLESLKVAEAAWSSRWYDCNTNIQKGLVLIIIRAQKPCILTAGQFYTMSLQTFVQILRASYTYVALLRQMFAREEEKRLNLQD